MDKEELLGDFRIIKKLGGGPLGDLLLAEHRFVRKKFALKVLPKELTEDQTFFQRFEEAVIAIADLNHLNLVKVHNISSDGSRYFLVTDYISDDYGAQQNLSTYLSSKTERLSEREVLAILKQVAYGLDYIHSKSFSDRQMIHGGVKLNNILVGQTEENALHIYLSDYGLSSIAHQGFIFSRMLQTMAHTISVDSSISPLKSEGRFGAEIPGDRQISKEERSFLQSYAFLAPEQKIGGSKDLISAKSDVYSFGILAYFLLMGYSPEGYFALPSQMHKNLQYDWDLVITSTLSQSVSQRPEKLVELLERASDTIELKSTEESIEKISKHSYQKQSPSFSYGNHRQEERLKSEREENSYPKSEPQQEKPARPSKEEVIKEMPSKLAEPSKPKQDVSAFEQQLTRTGGYVRVSPMNRNSELKREVEEMNVATKEMKPKLNPSKLEQNEYEEDPGAIFHEKNVVMSYRPQKKDTTNIEPILSEMVVIEGGEYFRGSNMGARDERPRHKIFINPFAIDVHPVTNEQFLLFLEVMEGEKDASNNDIILLKESRIKRVAGKLMIESGYAKHPVVGVSWYGAIAYAKWIGKRIPTEVEWEIAASSGLEENVYPFGRHVERVQANFFSSDTTPVMSYPPTANGLYDMAGNVYEWCEDWYEYNYYEISSQEPSRPKGPKQGVYRVLRGGCWKSLQEDLRTSHRHRNNPGTMNRTYGFRCAADVQSS